MIKITRVAPLAISNSDKAGFIRVYKEAFGGSPYFETYSDEEVLQDVWTPHIEHGTIILALDDDIGRVIGLGCAIPLHYAPKDVQDFLKQSWISGFVPEEFAPTKTWYMSELAVDPAYRRQGVAYRLVRQRLLSASHAGVTHYVMRTATERSNSRHLYERVGADVLPGNHDISETDQVLHNGSKATSRVYLYGHAGEALGVVASLMDFDEESKLE